MTYDAVVVGAGFAGATVARRLADAGRRVLVLDQRPHVAGNAFDERDAYGVLIHSYGPHLFHTNSQLVVDFLSRFTAWRPYEHRVLARHDGQLYPIPINRTTLERFFGVSLADEAAAEALLAAQRESIAEIRSSEDVVLAGVGRRLYEAFFRGYTRKQWLREAAELDRSVTARIPVRLDRDDRYFTDRFQALPAAGYTPMFVRMLDHPGIELRLATAWTPAERRLAPVTVWTGPVDQWFGHRYGALPYRSLRFEHQHLPGVERQQSVGTVNEPDAAVPYTRTTDFGWLEGVTRSGTSIVREYPLPDNGGDPYYPVPTAEAKALYARYQADADAERGVVFVGRLAQYRYYNMDQVVAAALTAAEHLLERGAP
jgi:UDP-galactopyranose mutase